MKRIALILVCYLEALWVGNWKGIQDKLIPSSVKIPLYRLILRLSVIVLGIAPIAFIAMAVPAAVTVILEMLLQ